MYEGKSYPCYESGFHATCLDSIRVNRMEDMRLGLEKCTTEQFQDYLGKQPVFYFQERFAEVSPGYDWNGFLLFAIRGAEDARKVALAHQDELHIILSFDEPETDRYFILVDTGTGGGSPEEFLKWQNDVRDMCLRPYFRNPKGFDCSRYCRALTPSHYDIVNLDVLFGQPYADGPEASALAVHQMSLFATLFSSISQFFNKIA